jgi:hypothetical protein
MNTTYRRTQKGRMLRRMMVAPAIVVALAGFFAGKAGLFLPLAGVLCCLGWVFSSLTVEVSARELTWFFGPGLWRNRLLRTDIVGAAPCVNKWWWGWGIHLTPRGWLYNVAGLEAVEIELKSGRTLRIGSDEPAALASALRNSRRG